jgi:hypothetical protein
MARPLSTQYYPRGAVPSVPGRLTQTGHGWELRFDGRNTYAVVRLADGRTAVQVYRGRVVPSCCSH